MSSVTKMPTREAAERVASERVTAEKAPAEPADRTPSIPAPTDSVVQAKPVAGPAGRRKGRSRLFLMVGGVLAVAVASGYLWLHGGRWISVDDAYIHAAKLLVSTDVSGIVSEVDVKEGQPVKAGDILFRIDPLQFQIAVDNAKAQLAQTELTLRSMQRDYARMLEDVKTQQSQVALAQVTFDRNAALVSSNNVSRANYDQARYGLEVAKSTLISLQEQAQVQLAKLGGKPDLPIADLPQYRQAKAQLDEAQRQLDHTVVRAPFDGIATQVDALQVGTYLVAATAALTNTGAVGEIATDNVWIEAETKETDLTYAKVGDPVDVYVDAYPGKVWHGRVTSISPASGSEFSILPAQNASGNWVKVVQRIPVRITVDRQPSDPILRSGMTVTAEIDTGHVRSISDLWGGSPPVKEAERGAGGPS
jgi:membrane fusion protein (multidrug efflux system)